MRLERRRKMGLRSELTLLTGDIATCHVKTQVALLEVKKAMDDRDPGKADRLLRAIIAAQRQTSAAISALLTRITALDDN